MAQNITLLGAQYSDVPSVLLPKTGGGTASFTDVTDTTAAAADVAAGKYFYTASGVRTLGTGSGGGGTGGITQDQDGYLVLSPDGGGGGGATIPWWGCGDEELLHTTNYELKLSDTNWASLTPSTSSQSLTLPATAYSSAGTKATIDEFNCNIDLATDGVVVITDEFTTMAYTTAEDSMSVGHILRWAGAEIRYYGQDLGYSSVNGLTLSSCGSSTLTYTTLVYRSSSGTVGSAQSNYGFFTLPSNASPTITSSGSSVSKFIFYANASIRSNASSMDTTAWTNVDATNTKLKIRIRTYKVAYPGPRTGLAAHLKDMLNNAAFPTD